MKRVVGFVLLSLGAVVACQTTAEKADAPVDVLVLEKTCTDDKTGGYAPCLVWADALLHEDATRGQLSAALAAIEPFCTVDEPDACHAAHALRYRVEQPVDDHAWNPAAAGDWEYAPRVVHQSPQVDEVRAALSTEAWAGRVKERGVVSLVVAVKEDGQIKGVEVTSGPDPLLERLAMQAALDGRYLPGRTKAGVFRDGVVTVTMDFSAPAPAGPDAGAAATAEPPPSSSPGDAGPGATPAGDAGAPPRDAGAPARPDAGVADAG